MIIDVAGNSNIINLDFDKKTLNQITVKNNILAEKILDILVSKNDVFVSYIKSHSNDCKKFHLAKAKFDSKELIFNDIFVIPECGKFIQGGRIKNYTYLNKGIKKNGLLFSAASNVSDKPNDDPQNLDSFFGKIIFYNFDDKKTEIFSLGHRNPQGLLVYNDLFYLQNTARGRDEINKIIYGKNYGPEVLMEKNITVMKNI